MKKLNKKFIKLTPDYRLYNFDKPIIAFTGGIATGKSTVTRMLEAKGLKFIDADLLVKNIYRTEESRQFIQTYFPEAWINNEINFAKLRELVFSNPKIKDVIETYIYARLPMAFREAASKITNQDFYLYDVPLLFERDLDKKVDLKIVVYAPRKIQLARIIDRDGTKEDIANKILDLQMDIEDKKDMADIVVDNSRTEAELAASVENLLLQLLE